jgi:hypothetical protein
MKAKSTLLDDATYPLWEWPRFPISTGRRQVRTEILFFNLVFEIKISYPIRASNHAISATYASPEVLLNNAVIAMIGRFCRTHGNTRSIITVHAGHWDEFNALCWIFTLTDSDYSVPVWLSSPHLFFW